MKEKQDFFSTKGINGTGIGLMMTQKIVNYHGGSIELASRETEGTTIRITIPGVSRENSI